MAAMTARRELTAIDPLLPESGMIALVSVDAGGVVGTIAKRAVDQLVRRGCSDDDSFTVIALTMISLTMTLCATQCDRLQSYQHSE